MFNQPVVIDNGSGIIKAGFAGDEVPKCIFGNYVGRPKHVRVMAGGLQQDHFIGSLAEEHRGLLSKFLRQICQIKSLFVCFGCVYVCFVSWLNSNCSIEQCQQT